MDRKIEGFLLTVLPLPASLTILTSLWAVFFWVPTERFQGIVQRIFYYHVPSAWACFVAFIAAALASAVYLATRKPVWDRTARAAVEVGMLFASLVLITGPIWARPIWGAYWTWDARLTTTLILWLIYAGYLMLRAYTRDPEMASRLGAVVAIVGSLDIPLIVFSTRIWRTIHPAVLKTREGESGLTDPSMVTTLMICLLAFTLLATWLWALRWSGLRLEADIDRLDLRLEGSSAPL
jgi:heme exporter protein C